MPMIVRCRTGLLPKAVARFCALVGVLQALGSGPAQAGCEEDFVRHYGITVAVGIVQLKALKKASDANAAAVAKIPEDYELRLQEAQDEYDETIENANKPENAPKRQQMISDATSWQAMKLKNAASFKDRDTRGAEATYESKREQAAINHQQQLDNAFEEAGLTPEVMAKCPRVWIASSNVDAPAASQNYATLCAPTPVGKWQLVQSAAGGVGFGTMDIPTLAPSFTSAKGEAAAVGTFEAKFPASNGNSWAGNVLITKNWDPTTKARGVLEVHQRYLRKCKCTLAGCKPCEFEWGKQVKKWQIIAKDGLCNPAEFRRADGFPALPD